MNISLRFTSVVALIAVLSLTSTTHAQPLVTIDTVPVGDPGNTADSTGYGAVADLFYIGRYEVTISQYTTFLNAVASVTADSHIINLWNPSMQSDLSSAGISRSGAGVVGNPYIYAAISPSGTNPPGASSPGNRPISYVSWFDAARFANWMHNGATVGASTETGAYALNGASSGIFTVNPGAIWYLPSENQWYKAAYYKGGGPNSGYWSFPTQSNTQPGLSIGASANQANHKAYDLYAVTLSNTFSFTQNYLTDVGAYSNSASAYGTYDQGGNLWELNDTVINGSSRGMRGGYWQNVTYDLHLRSSSRQSVVPSGEGNHLGFRLASGQANAAPPITIDYVTVGDTVNDPDPATGKVFGVVEYAYKIGKYEVTNAQYTAFLNAVDPTGLNANGIYNASMDSDPLGGITYTSGAPSGAKYTIRTNMGDKPVIYVSWYDAARFANWLHNGQGTGDTETGAYTLSGSTGFATRNVGAIVWLPSENEWYKAAYFDPTPGAVVTDNYWSHATQSDYLPAIASAGLTGDITNPGENVANSNMGAAWNGQNGNVTTVGSARANNYYGTFDQAGNVWEWNDAVIPNAGGNQRGVRGGSWGSLQASLASSVNSNTTPTFENNRLGFRVASIVSAPEMVVSGNSVTILDGDTTPTGNDITLFPNLGLCGGRTITNVYTITNDGNTDLTLTGSPFVVLTGSSDFTVTQPSLSTIPAGGQTTFSVTFSPTSTGLQTAQISIANDDATVNPYDFTIQGSGVAPEIDVTGSASITDGSTSPSTSNGTDFGAVSSPGGTPVVQTYTITNNGNAPLLLNGISVSGANPGDFTVSALTPNVTSLAPGESATFTVTFSPLAVGVSTATITIGNSDCNEGPYEFDVQGEGHCNDEPEIAVGGLDRIIRDGVTRCSEGNDTSFGNVLVTYGAPVTHTFTITNSGFSTLSVYNIVVNSPSGAFTITMPQVPLPYAAAIPPVSAAPNNTMTFSVTFQPGSVGADTAEVTIFSDDMDESLFTFTVCGKGVKPDKKGQKMEVTGSPTPPTDKLITNSDMSPDVLDDTNFGTVSSSQHIHEFKIHNTGGPLTLLPINSIAPAPNSRFTVISQPTSPIVGGTYGTFRVRFNPSYFVASSAIITITSNVPDYTFKVSGNKRKIDRHLFDVRGNGKIIADGDSSPTSLDHTSIGNISIGQKRVRTFTIENTSDGPLKLGKVSVMSIDSMPGEEFTVKKQPAKVLAAGKKTSFTLQFMPSDVGASFGEVRIPYTDESSGADAKMANFEFMVKGTGTKSMTEKAAE
jgi:formylglycine-generating enzyme required for sulfatase activity